MYEIIHESKWHSMRTHIRFSFLETGSYIAQSGLDHVAEDDFGLVEFPSSTLQMLNFKVCTNAR